MYYDYVGELWFIGDAWNLFEIVQKKYTYMHNG